MPLRRDNITAMKHRVLLSLVLGVSAAAGPIFAQAQRAIQLPDILAWKRIQTPQISADGKWFAYKLAPNEGNGEIVIRSLVDGKDSRFPIGETPRQDAGFGGPPPPAPRDLQISDDSKWITGETLLIAGGLR